MGKYAWKISGMVAMAAVLSLAIACGGGGGGTSSDGGGGTTDIALAGTVSFPSIQAKPSSGGGDVSMKVTVGSGDLQVVPGAKVCVYLLSDTSFSNPIVTVYADENGKYQITTEQLGEYANRVLVVRAEVAVNGVTYGVKTIVDPNNPATDKDDVKLDPIVDAVTQKIVDVFNEFGLQLNDDQFRLIYAVVQNIVEEVSRELQEGIEYELDLADMLADHPLDYTGAADDLENTQGSAVSGLVSNAEMALVEGGYTDDEDLRVTKMIDFLALAGFPVSVPDHSKCYLFVEHDFFMQPDGSVLTPEAFAPALVVPKPFDLDGNGVTYENAPGIFLVDPNVIFFDGNTDGVVDDGIDVDGDGVADAAQAYFGRLRKWKLMESMGNAPVFAFDLARRLAAMVDAGAKVKLNDIAKAIAENFEWWAPVISIGPDGQPVFTGEAPLDDSRGGAAISTSDILKELLITVPATPHDTAVYMASLPGYLMDMADEAINEAIYEGYRNDPNFDPMVVFSALTDEQALFGFVKRSRVWERFRARMEQAIYAGFSQNLYGKTLTAEAELSIPETVLFINLFLNRPYPVDVALGYTRSRQITVTEGSTVTVVEPRWDNLKYAHSKVEYAAKGVFLSLLPDLFQGYTGDFEDALFMQQVWSLRESMAVEPDWQRGRVRDMQLDPAATVAVSVQVSVMDELGNETPGQGAEVALVDAISGAVTDSFVANGYGIAKVTGLAPSKDVLLRVIVSGRDPIDLPLFTDPYAGAATDTDGDGDVDLVEIEIGRMPGDPPLPNVTLDPADPSTWRWSNPVVVPPAGGFISFPHVALLPGDAVNFSESGNAGFLNGPSFDVQWDQANNLLVAGSGVNLYDVDEATLGIEGGLQEAYYKGGKGLTGDGGAALTSIDAYKGDGAAVTSLTPQAGYFDANGQYHASLYLVETGESKDFNADGTAETYAWLIEVKDIGPDGSLVVEFAIVKSDGTLMVPPDPYAPTFRFADYFPLTEGNMRYYVEREEYNGMVGRQELRYELMGASVTDETLPGWVLYPLSGGDLGMPTNYATYFGFDPDGNFFYVKDEDVGDGVTETSTFDPPVLLAYASSQIGQEVNFSGTAVYATSEGKSLTFEVNTTLRMDRFETVEVPAGRFENCLVIQFFRDVFDGATGEPVMQETNTLWFAKGVGEVKSKYEEWDSTKNSAAGGYFAGGRELVYAEIKDPATGDVTTYGDTNFTTGYITVFTGYNDFSNAYEYDVNFNIQTLRKDAASVIIHATNAADTEFPDSGILSPVGAIRPQTCWSSFHYSTYVPQVGDVYEVTLRDESGNDLTDESGNPIVIGLVVKGVLASAPQITSPTIDEVVITNGNPVNITWTAVEDPDITLIWLGIRDRRTGNSMVEVNLPVGTLSYGANLPPGDYEVSLWVGTPMDTGAGDWTTFHIPQQVTLNAGEAIDFNTGNKVAATDPAADLGYDNSTGPTLLSPNSTLDDETASNGITDWSQANPSLVGDGWNPSLTLPADPVGNFYSVRTDSPPVLFKIVNKAPDWSWIQIEYIVYW